jgi:hypothetical protein
MRAAHLFNNLGRRRGRGDGGEDLKLEQLDARRLIVPEGETGGDWWDGLYRSGGAGECVYAAAAYAAAGIGTPSEVPHAGAHGWHPALPPRIPYIPFGTCLTLASVARPPPYQLQQECRAPSQTSLPRPSASSSPAIECPILVCKRGGRPRGQQRNVLQADEALPSLGGRDRGKCAGICVCVRERARGWGGGTGRERETVAREELWGGWVKGRRRGAGGRGEGRLACSNTPPATSVIIGARSRT